MSTDHATPLTETDRQIADLMESYRHYKTDPRIPEPAKEDAAERMRPVWEKIAILQDPHGFTSHLADEIDRARRERARGDRKRPLCRCEQPRHICDAKQGEVPRKIRARDYEYLSSGNPRQNAREYVQEHPGDVIVREAMESYRNLRTDIYQRMNAILIDLRAAIGADDGSPSDGGEDAPAPASGVEGPVMDPTEDNSDSDALTTGADLPGVTPDELADVESLADLEREVREQLTEDQALDLTDGEGPKAPEVCPNCETPADSEYGGFVRLSTDPSVEDADLHGVECLNCEKTISGREMISGDYREVKPDV